jgi:thymidylate synthase (FAD)
MYVFLLDHMGTDNSVVNAARVSFNKDSKLFTEQDNKRLIEYLAKHNHWSPFAHTCLKFKVEAPIFVARQLAKHQVGLAWNEVSRRYVDDVPDVWIPKVLRKTAPNIKQGSLDECVDNNENLLESMEQNIRSCVKQYTDLLEAGVCPEQARAVLPLAAYTEWIWTGSLYAFFRVFSLRSHSSSQKETQDIALKIGQACEQLFPWSWRALVKTLERTV